MTNEAAAEAALAEVAHLTEYIQVQVPGFDYSKAFIPWGADFAAYARQLRELSDALIAEFYPEQPLVDASAGAEAPPLPPEPPRPQQRQAPPQQPMNGQRGQSSGQRAAGGPQGNAYGVTLYCPKHPDQELVPSFKNKAMDDVEIDGITKAIPASWFHSLPDKSTCSTFQSKAIWGRQADPVQAR